MRTAIVGGTGFVGGHLAAALVGEGHRTVVVARGRDTRPFARQILQLPGVEFVRAGLNDERELVAAFGACDAIAHCAGINRETGPDTFDAVHVRGTQNVVRAAESAGARRLALVSYLRARPDCGSGYHESKWAAEEVVRSSSLDWTVVKPAMTYGRGDHMIEHLSRALYTFPVFLGVGRRRVRPLAVGDLVRVLFAALVDSAMDRSTVPVMGPTELTIDDAARMVARVLGKRRLFISAPLPVHYALASGAEAIMTVPLISTAQVRILEEEQVEPAAAPDTLPRELVPTTRFDEAAVRAALPEPGGFRLADFRWPRRRPSTPSSARNAGVTICGEGRPVIRRPPSDILEFVLDVTRYRKADHKVGRVHYIKRDGNRGEVRHGGRVLRLPAPPANLRFELTPPARLDFTGISMPWPLRGFTGHFTCEASPEGTVVVHRECFTFGSRMGRLVKPVFGWWISRDTPAEVLRMKRLLEGDT